MKTYFFNTAKWLPALLLPLLFFFGCGRAAQRDEASIAKASYPVGDSITAAPAEWPSATDTSTFVTSDSAGPPGDIGLQGPGGEDGITHGQGAPAPAVPNAHGSEAGQGATLLPASMAYQYPVVMQQNEARDVFVRVRARADRRQVAGELADRIVKFKETVTQDDTNHIITVDIPLYRNMTVSLRDPNSDFEVDTVHPSDRQLVDTINGNNWHWTVSTHTHKKTGRLIISVTTDNENSGLTSEVASRDITLNIKFEPWTRKVADWLIQNPEYVTTSILVPIGTFLGARWFNRRRRKNKG